MHAYTWTTFHFLLSFFSTYFLFHPSLVWSPAIVLWFFFFLHSTSIPQVFSYPILPASHSLSHPPCLLSSLPLATSLLSFSFGPLLFPPFRLADVQLWLHRGDDIMSHNLSSTSQRERAGYFSAVRNSLIINWNKTALCWACVYAYHLLSKWYNTKSTVHAELTHQTPHPPNMHICGWRRALSCSAVIVGHCSNLQTLGPLWFISSQR